MSAESNDVEHLHERHRPGVGGVLGAALDLRARPDPVGDAADLESWGYATVWLPGGQLDTLVPIVELAAGTNNVGIGTAVLAVERCPAASVAATYSALELTAPGRFAVGIGGGHGPRPLRTVGAYLDELDATVPAVPPRARVLAALGPRKLELAAARCGAAQPLLVTPDYTRRARAIVGAGTGLIVHQYVVLDDDPVRARATARVPLRFLTTVPGYAQSFRRQGFHVDDVEKLGERLIDGLIAWGDDHTVAGRLREHLEAGADQVVVCVLPTVGSPDLPEIWSALARRVLPRPAPTASPRPHRNTT